jgi:cytochrome c556
MIKGLKWGSVVGFAAIALVSGGVGVLAQGDADSVIKARQDAMKAMGKSMAAVKGYLEGKNDVAAAQQGADTIAQTAPKISSVFPKGTSMTDIPGNKTGAKAAIWSDWDKFVSAQKQLETESQKLVQVVKSGDKAKIGEQFAATGKMGCGTCHETFRQKLER